MNKKTISIIASFIFLIFIINFVSAGLCKGSDGYYHDCNDFSYRYYNRNFYPNYKTEYYKETSTSSSSVISIKEDRHTYEELKASSSAESSIEMIKKERDYSYPRYRYDRYGRKRYYDDYYEWDDEPHLVVFLNKAEPIHYNRRANAERYRDNYDDWDDYYDYSDWRYYDGNYDDYYYKPRYSYDKDEYNWRW